jgi:hypothetical protein
MHNSLFSPTTLPHQVAFEYNRNGVSDSLERGRNAMALVRVSDSQVYVQPGRVSIHSFFVSESLRKELFEKNALLLKGTSLDGI